MSHSEPSVPTINSEADITRILQNDPWRMQVLQAAEGLHLSDWWIGAGFLRNLVWDTLENKPPQISRDIDLVYFDAADIRPETDWAYDERMKTEFPFADWEVRNQARMHYKNDFPAFTSTEDGISHWVETATCVAVKLEKGTCKYLFCYGTDDLFSLVARPTPHFRTPELLTTFHKRVSEKQWQQRWPHLQVRES